jgi:hypothetical protein
MALVGCFRFFRFLGVLVFQMRKIIAQRGDPRGVFGGEFAEHGFEVLASRNCVDRAKRT